MQFKHKRTGKIYTKLHDSFSVERQAPSVIYINDQGQIFDRDAKIFAANFSLMRTNAQKTIKPHDPARK